MALGLFGAYGYSKELMLPSILLLVVIFGFGIVIGSFLNVCIYRIPKGETLISKPSHCMTCGERIKPYDLIPLFSWLFLGGKCRNCKSKISGRYPLVEFLNGLMFVLAFLKYDFSLKSIVYALFLSTLIVVAFMDWDTQEINLGVLLVMALLTVPMIFVNSKISLLEHGIGLLIISIPFFLIVLISKERAMGMGDAILMAAGGLFLGWKAVLVAAFIGIISAAIAGIIIKLKAKTSKFAFGPWLSLGLACAVFFGNELFNWYVSLVTFR